MQKKPAKLRPRLRLGINIDHIATLRNARVRAAEAKPDLLRAAGEAIKGGADSITFHLREDRRHILDEDARRLKKHLRVPINLEMAATGEMRDIALRLKPHAICLVPEKRREVTTEGGLDAASDTLKLKKFVGMLGSARIRVSLFIDPDPEQVLASLEAGAAAVELHTGSYCNASGTVRMKELKRLQRAARQADHLGLEVHAGHGLDYGNVAQVAAIPEITELNIGHFLVGEALFAGLADSRPRNAAAHGQGADMIIGTGNDMVDIRRVRRVLSRHGERFMQRCFTDAERKKAGQRTDPVPTYAKRFAAKEACCKALGTGFRRGVFFRDMGVVNLPSGQPTMELTGGALARLKEITPPGMKARIHVTITDEAPWAQALVIIEGLP